MSELCSVRSFFSMPRGSLLLPRRARPYTRQQPLAPGDHPRISHRSRPLLDCSAACFQPGAISKPVNSRLVDYDPWFDCFTKGTIREFAEAGIYPPTMVGNPRNPEVVILSLATQERWRDPPPLRGTDEQGVERQRREFEEDVAGSGCR